MKSFGIFFIVFSIDWKIYWDFSEAVMGSFLFLWNLVLEELRFFRKANSN